MATLLTQGQRVVSPDGSELGQVARVGRGRFLMVQGANEVWLRDEVISRSVAHEVQLVCDADHLFTHVATPPSF